jgi:hypothetical protein
MKPRHIVLIIVILDVLGIGVIVWKVKSVVSNRRELAVSGFVLKPDGTPASGATVHLLVSPDNPRDQLPSPPRGTTDVAGRFRIGPVQPYNYFVVATHTRHCDSLPVQVLVDGRRRGLLTIRLTPGGRITGTVRPSEGPVAGRQIHLKGYDWRRTTSTDSSGAYAFEGLMAGEWSIFLEPPEGSKSSHFRQQVNVEDGQTTVFDVKSNSSLPPIVR